MFEHALESLKGLFQGRSQLRKLFDGLLLACDFQLERQSRSAVAPILPEAPLSLCARRPT